MIASHECLKMRTIAYTKIKLIVDFLSFIKTYAMWISILRFFHVLLHHDSHSSRSKINIRRVNLRVKVILFSKGLVNMKYWGVIFFPLSYNCLCHTAILIKDIDLNIHISCRDTSSRNHHGRRIINANSRVLENKKEVMLRHIIKSQKP